jgi:PAS domain S-box-containing protein
MIASSGTTIGSGKYNIPLLLALIAAGLAGNYFRFPIFLNIDFLFGSIFAMLALQFFGLSRGILAAAAIAGYTYLIWNHPYALIIMTAEVAVVSWLMTRRKIGMVLADALFWLAIGMPLVYLFYHLVMQTTPTNTYIVMTKQAVNGIANALVARLLFTGYQLRSRSSLISYKEIISNLLVFFLFFPVLILLARESRKDFADTDLHIRSTLTQLSKIKVQRLETWVVDRKAAIINLAGMAASRTPQQMQPHLEQVMNSDANLLRVGLADKEATSVAFSPITDETGKSAVGVSFAERPYVPVLKQSLKPILSELVMGKVGIIKPRILVLAPVVIREKYNGYVFAVLIIDQLQAYLDTATKEYGTLYTLVDKNDKVIMTNRSDQTVMKPFVRGKGTLTRLDKNISQWIPPLSANIPISERWKKSLYVAESTVGDLAEWRLVLEQPVAPFQKALYEQYTGNLFLLFLMLFGALVLAEFLSHKAVVTLEQLSALTYELPARLATDGKNLVWPESGITEAAHLVRNFRKMADSMTDQFQEVRQINQTLEQRVEERTEELRDSEHRWKFAIEGSGDGVWDWNIETDTVDYSRLWKEMLGYADTDILPANQEWVSRIHPDDQGDVADTMQAYLDGKTAIYVVEYRLKCKDESYKWILGRGMVVNRSEDGKPLRMIGTHTDITKRKQAEDNLRNREEVFSLFMKHSPFYTYIKEVTSTENRVLQASENFQQMIGIPGSEMAGKTMSELFPAEMAAKITADDWSVVSNGEILEFEEDFNGRNYNTIKFPVVQGDTLYLAGYTIDITERKKAGQELLQAKAAADSANNAKSQFLSNMSHEIRTPMNGVLGMTQLLEMTDLTDEQLEYTSALKLSANNLLSLINDILDLSKIEAGKVELELSDFSLKHCINDVVLMQKSVISGKDLKMNVTHAEDIPRVLIGDQLRIKQIFHNLLGNAVKFTAQGSISLSTQLREHYDESVVVEIAVRDSGIGIPPEAFDRIFKPFTQADGSTTRRFGGTGLGLTISRRLVELMGGSIAVESAQGVGSCFIVTLPLSIGSGVLAAREDAYKRTIDPDGPALRILMVEDDLINITFGTTLLKKLGHNFMVAVNGRECLAALEKGVFDLVLMDIQMPVMNGQDALMEIRSKERESGAHLPLIAVTAHSMRGDKERFLELGFDGYQSKPLIASELVEEMRRVITRIESD